MEAVEEEVSGFTVTPEDWRAAAYYLLGITINTCTALKAWPTTC